MRAIMAVDIPDKVEAWASTKGAVVELAAAVQDALARAKARIHARCGQYVDTNVKFTHGRIWVVATAEEVYMAVCAVNEKALSRHWSGSLNDWISIAGQMRPYTYDEFVYDELMTRLPD